MPNSNKYSAYLMVTSDPDYSNIKPDAKLPKKGEAYSLALSRLNKNYWVLFSGTALRTYVVEGTKLLFYIGGKKFLGGHVIASAIVEKVESWKYSKGIIDDEKYSTDLPAYVLRLSQVELFNQPISLQANLPNLSFAPKNLHYWGVVLQGGCVGLSENDLEILNPREQVP